ncbi:hypothetical protein BKP45_13745 [Anaerobacillus alkalidiazotrophicus]|uniref:DUF4097 domain-containing protein n=1 Tax=Anaerobacillus alkalidiazotrophicus TaxID=472963 RepID=A0A1S2M3E8_9BACI|nr:DUF4097 family beta strand repeat-containing protein [Anaerobacillus alkalidiazotrophicus]OIJ19218.1 hypothetical protein BKP45_13745 [Anaerobacillus alkalidiazotrophicus]
MNKVTFLGLSLIVIGLFALVITFNQPFFGLFSDKVVNINEYEVIDGRNISNIDVSISSHPVLIKPTKNNDIRIEFEGKVSEKYKKKFTLEVKKNNDILQVGMKNKSPIRTGFNFRATRINMQLNIYVPEKLYDSISISSSSGKVIATDLQAKNFDIRASSGKIEVINLFVEKNLKLEASSGRIEAKDSVATFLAVTASSGTISLSNVITEKLAVTSSSGRINLSDIEGDIIASSSSGEITIVNEELTNDITADTSSGSVEVKFTNSPSSAIIDFLGSSGNGNVHIPGMNFEEKSNNRILGTIGSESHKVKVRTSSGSFYLK